MIPATYPSQLDENNTTQMVVYYLSNVSGLERWKDYIPVKETPLASPELNSFNTNGAIYTTALSSIVGKQAWVDYIPVYEDSLATDAWTINAVGYLTTKSEVVAKALAVIASYGTDAHVYLPGIGVINGLTAGNYLDSAGTTAATVDNPVGLVLDAAGAIDASQATTANKPILRRGAVNLLTYSEQFGNEVWIKSNTTVTSNTTTAPDGTITADTITSSGANGYIYQTFSAIAGTTYTFSCYVKSVSTATTLQIALLNASGASGIANVEFTTTGEWIRVSVTGTSAITQTAWVAFGTGGAFNTGETFYAWGAQLEAGSTASTYIPTTTAAASSTTGNYAWEFDGSNDSLALGSVPFQMADDHCIVTGFKATANATNKTIFSQTETGSSQAPWLRVNSANKLSIAYVASGFTAVTRTSVADVVTSPFVASVNMVRKIGRMRINAVDEGATFDISTITFPSSAVSSIGSFNNSSLFFVGSLFPQIYIKGTVSDVDLLILEKFVGQLSGVTI